MNKLGVQTFQHLVFDVIERYENNDKVFNLYLYITS